MTPEVENTPIHVATEEHGGVTMETPIRDKATKIIDEIMADSQARCEANESRFALEVEAMRYMEDWTRAELTRFLEEHFKDVASLIVNGLTDADLIALVKEARSQ